MYAKIGDWLVVHGHSDDQRPKRAQIIDVHGADGTPPYVIRWLDDDREVLTFPGPDAQVLTPEQVAEQDRIQVEQIERVQAKIADRGAAETRKSVDSCTG